MSREARRVELPIASADTFHPRYVVWELTLRCDQPCTHCGSRAGDARPSELDTDEALRVVGELAAMKAAEVVLIGGEAYLHPGFLRIITALRDAGVRPTMTTGGRGVDAALAREVARAGLVAASVSIDGLEKTHDTMRAAKGSFASASNAISFLKAEGVHVASNTNVNRWNRADLEPLYDHLKGLGIESWQVQLTTPLGRAADRPDMILQPYDLLDLLPRIAALKVRARADGILLMPGNNLGYFGPEEATLRSLDEGGVDHFHGCQAGRYVLGIESDGAVKGCPSLQTAHYVGGNLRSTSLDAIWSNAKELAFARARTKDDLWGFCATCDFNDVCLGGCTFTAHAILGRPGNNPYCHYRARTMRSRGLRERLVHAENASGNPFDNGRFEVVEEPFESVEESVTRPLLQIRRKREKT